MKKIFSILLFTLISSASYPQQFVAGIYHFHGECVSHTIDFLSDSSSVRTIDGRSGAYKYVGKWSLKKDTIILIEKFKSHLGIVEKSSDTVKFHVKNRLRLDEIIHHDFNMSFSKQLDYYPNGKISMEVKGYDIGYPFNGIITTYHNNGLIDEIRNYKKWYKQGSYLKYNEAGILITSGSFKKNKPVGKWLYYNDNGSFEKVEKGKSVVYVDKL